MIVGAILAAGLVASASIVSATLFKMKKLDQSISVTGSTQKTVMSDIVKWRSSFSRTVSPDGLANGYALMKKDNDVVQKYLLNNKILATELTVNPVFLTTNYNYNNGNQSLTGYTLTERLEVQSTDLKKITDLEKKIGEQLSQQGVVFANESEEFYYSKFADLKVSMLADATKNAKERAQQIAESDGLSVGHITSAAMGVFQVTAVNSVDVSDYGSYDTSVQEKQVTAVVRASFLVQ